MVDPILEVSNLHKAYGTKKVLNDVSIKVFPGEVFGFLGPNGAGKTTTVRVILGLASPDRGTVKINGYGTKESFKRAIACEGAVVETPNFYNYLSGYKNILLIANLHPRVPKSRIEQVLKNRRPDGSGAGFSRHIFSGYESIRSPAAKCWLLK